MFLLCIVVHLIRNCHINIISFDRRVVQVTTTTAVLSLSTPEFQLGHPIKIINRRDTENCPLQTIGPFPYNYPLEIRSGHRIRCCCRDYMIKPIKCPVCWENFGLPTSDKYHHSYYIFQGDLRLSDQCLAVQLECGMLG